MSKICRITIFAYLFGDIPKGDEYGYNDWDLENAIEYCEALKAEGLTHEPHDGFCLTSFVQWTKEKINDDRVHSIPEHSEGMSGANSC